MANTKVGIATMNSGRLRSTDLVALSVTSAGNNMALNIATGMKSSHSTSDGGRFRLVR
jgi:hypothetical protein